MAQSSTKYHRVSSSEFGDDATYDLNLQDISLSRNETGKSQWTHIKDLDTFFMSIYQFWNGKGFFCFVLEEVLGLMQFVFVICLAMFILTCVNFSEMVAASPTRVRLDEVLEKFFHDHNHTGTLNTTLRKEAQAQFVSLDNNQAHHLWDAVDFSDFAQGRLHWLWYFILACALAFWFHRAIRVCIRIHQMWKIRQFYRDVLEISPSEMENFTWPEVLACVMKAQRDVRMCMHKSNFTELDIHNRILRFKNFSIAMINKKVLPVQFEVPLLGKRTFFTEELKYLCEMALFWGPNSPFRDNSSLCESFRLAKPEVLTERLERHIAWYALAALLLSPLIFIWQFFYSTFMLVALYQRKEGLFALRKWSLYARQKLRLFNELDHQFDLRLGKAYTPANKYVRSFLSPAVVIVARNVMFWCAAILALLIVFTVLDEDLMVPNVALAMTGLVATIGFCRAVTRDEGDIIDPEDLMERVVINTVEGPMPAWQGRAHTLRVHDAFCNLFQYRMTFWLEQVLSPILTPYILYFYYRPRAEKIVAFLRAFTVSVEGVGDICSFAQLDVNRHGDPKFKMGGEEAATNASASGPTGPPSDPTSDAAMDAKEAFGDMRESSEDGKVEMSLINFSLSNPGWTPCEKSVHFMRSIMESAGEDAQYASMLSPVESLPPGVAGSPDSPTNVFGPGRSIYPSLHGCGHQPKSRGTSGLSSAAETFESLSMMGSLREDHYEKHKDQSSAWAPAMEPSLSSCSPRVVEDRIRRSVGHSALYLQGHVAQKLLDQRLRMRSIHQQVSPQAQDYGSSAGLESLASQHRMHGPLVQQPGLTYQPPHVPHAAPSLNPTQQRLQQQLQQQKLQQQQQQKQHPPQQQLHQLQQQQQQHQQPQQLQQLRQHQQQQQQVPGAGDTVAHVHTLQQPRQHDL